MRVKVERAGEFGVVSDRPPSDIPSNAWTSALNVRFLRDYATPVLGYESTFTPAGEMFYVTGMLVDGAWMFVYPVDADADGDAETLYCYDGDAEHEITHAAGDYAGTGRWTGSVLNGVVIYNNEGDCPQYWGGDITTTAKDLIWSGSSSWDDFDGAGGDYRAKVLRPFRNFLVAMNISETVSSVETAYPYLVHWSNPADPGTIPDSWDYADPTTLSGRTDLADSPGEVVDGLTLRDMFLVYKEDAIWIMSYIGGQYQFRFDKLTGTYGIIALDCVVDIGGQHVVWGPRTAYITDGSTIRDILEDRYKDEFWARVNTKLLDKCFLVHNRKFNEVWFCYVPVGGSRVAQAHVYNYLNGAWSRRELPELNHIALQQYTAPGDPESWPAPGDTRSWDSDTTLGWDSLTYDPTATTLIGAGEEMWVVDHGSNANGNQFSCTLERRGIRLGDGGNQFFARELYPRFGGSGTVQLTVGLESPIADTVDWGTAEPFTIGQTIKTNMTLSGELVALRLTSNGSERWKLAGYEFDIENIGRY